MSSLAAKAWPRACETALRGGRHRHFNSNCDAITSGWSAIPKLRRLFIALLRSCSSLGNSSTGSDPRISPGKKEKQKHEDKKL